MRGGVQQRERAEKRTDSYMAEIRPFRALRYSAGAGDIAELTCPPYDIISEEQRLAYLARNPHNIIRLEQPNGDYEGAGKTLSEWLEAGVLRRDDDPGLTIYEEEFEADGQLRRVKGFVCLVKLEEFSKGVVLPHEETLSKAKEDRFRLMQATNCNFSQIYSLYMDETHTTASRLNALSAGKPRCEFSDGAVTHRTWLVDDREAVKAICGDFENRKLYIADGHHRYETALRYRDDLHAKGLGNGAEDYVMMMLVDLEDPGLTVFPTHRLVRGLADFSAETLLSACAQDFDVLPRDDLASLRGDLAEQYRLGRKAFGLYSGGSGWALLTLKNPQAVDLALPGKSEAYRSLDVSVLHSLILEKYLGIDRENMARQINLTYTRSSDEAVASVRSGESQCAFLLNPTRVSQIRDVASAGEKMPQKSTYFYPKLITGLVLNQLSF